MESIININDLDSFDMGEQMRLNAAIVLHRMYDTLTEPYKDPEKAVEEVRKLEDLLPSETKEIFDKADNIVKVLGVNIPQDPRTQSECLYKICNLFLNGETRPTRIAELVISVIHENEFCAKVSAAAHKFSEAE